jgi:anti-sigma regulatory factor (Ser/Thr protein kinase)
VAQRTDRVHRGGTLDTGGSGARERALMRPRWLLVLAASAVVLGVVVAGLAVMTAATLPLVLVLGATVFTLVAGAGTRLRHRAERRGRRAPVRSDVGRDDLGTAVCGMAPGAAPRLHWSTQWEADPPVPAVPQTRERVTEVLAEWGLMGEPVEPTLLVVTELLSNAIDHARGPVRLSVELSAEEVHVEVHDATPDAPQLRPPNPARARGRGVYLVEQVSSRWGWTADPPGKVVWADVPTAWPA